MPIRRHALWVAVLVLLASCSGAPEVDDTQVLGVATGRGQQPTATPAESTPPPPAATTDVRTEVPAPRPTTTATPADVTATATPDATPGPPPPEAGSPDDHAGAANPAPSPSTTATAEPQMLASGDGWTMNALLPDPDGEGWTEVGGPPAVERDGDAAVRLFVRLLHEAAPGDSAGRRAACEAWLEAPAEGPLRAHGDAVVELLVDGEAIADQRLALDVTVQAGGRHDLPGWQRMHPAHASNGAAVACVVAFAAAG